MSERRAREARKGSNTRKKRLVRKIKIEEDKLDSIKRTYKQINARNQKEHLIRNLKILSSTSYHLLPFVLSATITCGAVNFFGGGLPIVRDDLSYYKTYNLEYESNGEAIETTTYQPYDDYIKNKTSNILLVYTPWEREGTNYIRYKKQYIISNPDIQKLYTSIFKEDYQEIDTILKDYIEEKQVRNTVDLENNSYQIEARISYLNIEETIPAEEPILKNIAITLIDSLITFLLGLVFYNLSQLDYSYEIGKIDNDYLLRITDIKPWQEEMKKTKRKILTLKRKEENEND